MTVSTSFLLNPDLEIAWQCIYFFYTLIISYAHVSIFILFYFILRLLILFHQIDFSLIYDDTIKKQAIEV